MTCTSFSQHGENSHAEIFEMQEKHVSGVSCKTRGRFTCTATQITQTEQAVDVIQVAVQNIIANSHEGNIVRKCLATYV